MDGGDGEVQVLPLCQRGGVDPDHGAAHIDQRSAAIAVGYGGGGLNQGSLEVSSKHVQVVSRAHAPTIPSAVTKSRPNGAPNVATASPLRGGSLANVKGRNARPPLSTLMIARSWSGS